MRIWALPEADTYFRGAMSERGFQVEHLDVARKYVERRRTAVDGGAHVGTWSVELARWFERVLAFEPARDSFECCVENVRECGSVEVYPVALGECAREVMMQDDATRPGNTGARYAVPGAGVTMRPLDSFDVEDLDLLKLDLEGGELAALVGAARTIERCSPLIIMEVKKLGTGRPDPQLAVAHLIMLGYRYVDRTRNDWVFVR